MSKTASFDTHQGRLTAPVVKINKEAVIVLLDGRKVRRHKVKHNVVIPTPTQPANSDDDLFAQFG
jgi:hypothetical protein